MLLKRLEYLLVHDVWTVQLHICVVEGRDQSIEISAPVRVPVVRLDYLPMAIRNRKSEFAARRSPRRAFVEVGYYSADSFWVRRFADQMQELHDQEERPWTRLTSAPAIRLRIVVGNVFVHNVEGVESVGQVRRRVAGQLFSPVRDGQGRSVTITQQQQYRHPSRPSLSVSYKFSLYH